MLVKLCRSTGRFEFDRKGLRNIKDFSVMECGKLNWSSHIENWLIKANKVLCSLQRNVVKVVKAFTKLGLCNSLVLSVLLYGLNCAQIRRTDMVKLEKFQKKAVFWILGSRHERYINQLRVLNVLPLPMYIQLNDILTLDKLKNDKSKHIVFSEIYDFPGRSKDLFNLRKIRTEKARGEIVFKTSKIVNRLNKNIDFLNPKGLKKRVLKELWKFCNESFGHQNIAHGSFIATAEQRAERI